MNIIQDQEGIFRRYKREGEGWNEHLSNTKKFILDCCEESNAKNIAILGSGWLLDIPIEELAKKHQSIDLYDINHPDIVKEKVSPFVNVNLIIKDLTARGIEEAYKLVRDYRETGNKQDIKSIIQKSPTLEKEYDLVISVNLLNQLDILIVDYIIEENIYSKEEITMLRKGLQEQHLQLLTNSSFALITDFYEEVYQNGNLVAGKDLIHVTLPKGNYSKEWIWKFDSKKTYNSKGRTQFKVTAIYSK